jgi:hypothetical protein
MVKLSIKWIPQLAGMGPLTQATLHQYTCYRHRTGRLEAAANAIFTNNFCPMVKLSMKLAPKVASVECSTRVKFHQYISNRYRTVYGYRNGTLCDGRKRVFRTFSPITVVEW